MQALLKRGVFLANRIQLTTSSVRYASSEDLLRDKQRANEKIYFDKEESIINLF